MTERHICIGCGQLPSMCTCPVSKQVPGDSDQFLVLVETERKFRDDIRRELGAIRRGVARTEIINYCIITEARLGELETSVRNKIDEGWQPQGSVFLSIGESLYCQPMVFEEVESDD